MASDGDDATQPSTAASGVEEEQAPPSTNQQLAGEPDHTPISSQTASQGAPPVCDVIISEPEAPPKEQLSVISEATETSNGACPVLDSSPISLSPAPQKQHTKPGGHHHGNGRARLGSRASVSYAGSPRPSLTRRASDNTEAVTDGNKPNDYLIFTILACFCPVWPINIVGLTFSVMSRNSLQQGNVDGARRLGRNAKVLSIVSFVGGVIIIAMAIAVNWGILLKS
ncbi:trafficking regulator of GLUT4 1 [Alosa sapidissima]|uniref:trafficking regulator of GLUT4 1 n=1 Tax=Alosa sapidissima TaxID=34773 RepID=UPI001C09B996|nr:trafficking regulator of GLUT4 1 [Alosa sapidissima]